MPCTFSIANGLAIGFVRALSEPEENGNGEAEKLTDEKGGISSLVWSPDGSQIAFVSDATGKKEIYVADVLGLEVRQITRHNTLAVSPRFSPNGRYLSYTSYHPGNPNLYVTDLNQASTTRAISRRKGLNLAPAWSPDGRTMVITLSKDGNPDLYLINNEGVILNRLTRNTGINVSPAWSPDGKHITFVSDRSGTPQIYIMNVKTKSVRRITFQGNDNTEPSWSPDGEWIAFHRAGNLYKIRPDGTALAVDRVTRKAELSEEPVTRTLGRPWPGPGRHCVGELRLERGPEQGAVRHAECAVARTRRSGKPRPNSRSNQTVWEFIE